MKIKYIFETHFHADFVSGHVDLAKKTGAKIIYGPTAQTDYKVHVAKDGEKFKLGKVSIIVLHTPGHTPESSTFLLKDEKKKDEEEKKESEEHEDEKEQMEKVDEVLPEQKDEATKSLIQATGRSLA